MAEPALKKQKTDTLGSQTFDEARQTVLKENSREDMLDGIFEAWDYDGNGSLTLEEILPFYMKSSKTNDVLEPQVRSGFEKFCSSLGQNPAEGLNKAAFKKWLSSLTNEQLATHFVRVKGWTSEAYKMNVNLAIVKDYRGKTIKEILDSPSDALRGLELTA
ncbi:Coatomer subunit alpha-2 [Durusdinium trenchii]|uniref:Coatomer subunit alpha-2 n=1 Tax=Durusdinium trenchii TaxID=1381693 RepID=A0ABP0MQY9_9DINO